jgi:putative acetyltransferase
LAFYAKHGYARRGPFGSYPEHPLSVFMGKSLLSATTNARKNT